MGTFCPGPVDLRIAGHELAPPPASSLGSGPSPWGGRLWDCGRDASPGSGEPAFDLEHHGWAHLTAPDRVVVLADLRRLHGLRILADPGITGTMAGRIRLDQPDGDVGGLLLDCTSSFLDGHRIRAAMSAGNSHLRR